MNIGIQHASKESFYYSIFSDYEDLFINTSTLSTTILNRQA